MPSSPDITAVPYTALQPATLRAVVEEFVTRSGTDYGQVEKTLDQRIADVMRQLERGDVVLVYDQRTETVNIARP